LLEPGGRSQPFAASVSDLPAKESLPLFERLQIESQSNCNRACWFCPRTYDRSGKYLDADGGVVRQRMPTAKILALLDEARDMGFSGLVGFHHYSEPLLDRRNTQLAQEARLRGMVPYLHTNGDALRQNDRLRDAVLAVYDRIVIGLYDYATNEELEAEKEFWRSRLSGASPEFSPIGVNGSRAARSIGVPRALVPSDARMSIPDLAFENAPCHRPLIRLLIQYDGEVCLCCEDTSASFDLGNVHSQSMRDIWFSEKHFHLIRELITGNRSRYALCRACPMPPTAAPPAGAHVSFTMRKYHPPTPAAS
jgi:2-deoxy-scyllo-inosamine dehydrogenase (SAM-dependent)/8-amino-3,8-dideoxy-alpha-D-manno-octulosonate transaminase